MAKNSFLDEATKFLGIYLIIKYILPVVLGFCMIAFIIQLIFGGNPEDKYKDMENVIVVSQLTDTVHEIINENYDKDIFEPVELGKIYLIDDEFQYTFKDKTKTVEEYDALAKAEVLKVYNKLKGNTLVGDRRDMMPSQRKVEFSFYLPKTRVQDFTFLCGLDIKYMDDGVVDEAAFEEQMSRIHITESTLERALRGW